MQPALGQFDPFDRSSGNGSRSAESDWTDESSIFDNQWGSAAATTFNPNDTDGQGRPLSQDTKQKFEKLYDSHHGKGEQSRKGDIRQSHIINDAKTFMCVLEMPEYQRERVLTILDDLDISSNNFGGTRYEKILLAICSLVADEALSSRLSADGPSKDVQNRLFLTDEFRDLMEVNEMSSSEHRRVRKMVRERSDHF